MKRVIDGRIYNTKEAHLIYKIVRPNESFSTFQSKLYKTKKGNYFAINQGGALGTSNNKRFVVFSEKEALAWCERYYVPVNVIKEYFNIIET